MRARIERRPRRAFTSAASGRHPLNRRGRAVARLCIVLILALPADLHPQDNGRIRSPDQFLGYPLGARFTDHSSILDYFRSLADATDRVRYLAYGRTVENRDLVQVVVGRPEYLARLDEVLSLNRELTRGDTNETRAQVISATNPAVIYFSYGIHGDEASASEAAMWTAYDLLTDPLVASTLDSLIVVLDPIANPDGRERYVQWYGSVVGVEPNADPQSLEHQPPWPGGRYNHYLFDLNRDWAFLTQPETRARVGTWWRWNPQVHVDFHEMTPNSTYFFFPAAAPINPIYPDHVRQWWRRFGEANAGAFDERGWSYFTAESFDMLYPGYGDTWPSLHGAIGMTYEQAGGGTAGLAYARDRDTLTLAMRATQHRIAGQTTLRRAAAEKSRLMLDFAAAHRTAADGSADIVLVPGPNQERLQALVEHLIAQGIEVDRALNALRFAATPYPGYSERTEFPAGSMIVRARQPRGRLAVTLLQPNTELRGEYSYDISSWSLPYAYGVEAHQTRSAPASGWVLATPQAPIGPATPPSAYGYLVAPGDRAAAGIVRYLRAGGAVRVLSRPSTLDGRQWPVGSWFVPAPGGLQDPSTLEAAGLAPFLVPVGGGLSESGIDLGSASARALRMPRVALVGGDGIVPSSYGAHWFYLERDLGLPPAALILEDLPGLDLARYDVIVLPDMEVPLLEERFIEVLGEWVRAGGHLIAVAGASEAVAGIGEITLRQPPETNEDEDAALDRLLATRDERERQSWLEQVPGVTLPIQLDPGHPFAWGATFDGITDRLFVLNVGGRSFEPMAGAEAVGFFGPDLPTLSGAADSERIQRLERSAWLLTVPVGSGDLTVFADDPLFRLFWHSTKPLYLNSILYGGF